MPSRALPLSETFLVWVAAWGLGTLALSGVIATLRYPLITVDPDAPAGVDLALYRGIVQRMRAGEDYYAAAGAELRTPRGPKGLRYPTRSVLNWRLPTLAWLSARAPDDGAVKAVFGLLAVLVWLAWVERLRREGSMGLGLLGGLLLLAPCLWGAPGMGEAYLVHEAWSGFLIALSLAVRGERGTGLAIALGAAALAVRELALPYVVVLAVLAWWEQRRGEALGWLLVVLVFLAAWASHAGTVALQQRPDDLMQPRGWIQFGGWWFVLKTAIMNVFLIVAPGWVTAMLLPAALLGLAGWSSSTGQRLACTVLAYVLSFLVVGQPFNYLWGLMYAPLWPMGLLFLPQRLNQLVGRGQPPAEPAGFPE